MRLAPLMTTILSLIVALAVVETATRVLLPTPRFHLSGLELDARLGFRGVPSHTYEWVPPTGDQPPHEVRLNEEGLRGRSVRNATAASPPNVVFLGDSFLVGESVPQSALITERVESHLRTFERPAHVYNLSVVDYGTGQQILLFDRFADRLRPETVVLALYPTNDIANNSIRLAGRTRVSPGDAIRPYVEAEADQGLAVRWVFPLRSALRRASHAFAMIERGFFPPRVEHERRSGESASTDSESLPREFLEVFRSHEPQHPWELAWRETEALVLALRERCRERGARLVVAVIPSVHQVRQTPRTIGFDLEMHASGRALEEAVDWDWPETRLEAFGRTAGIEVVSLLPGFRREAAMGGRLYTRDHHLSVAGHSAAAREIARAIAFGAPEAAPAPVERVAWSRTTNPAFLRFDRQPHAKHLSDGWIEWQAATPQHPGGWRIGGRGAIALRASSGRLAVRGYALRPLTLDVAFLGGGPRRRAEIAQAGPFALRMPMPASLPRSKHGQTAILFDVGPAVGDLFIQAVGFAGD